MREAQAHSGTAAQFTINLMSAPESIGQRLNNRALRDALSITQQLQDTDIMTAQIYTLDTGAASFTRRAGTLPAWHGLGGETPADAPIERWQVNSGMDFSIHASPVEYIAASGAPFTADGFRVLSRDDTGKALGIVSDRYKIVQPRQVLEFFRDLTVAGGFVLETAGVLGEGGKYWALATNGASVNLSGDILKPYLLLATACDGSMATTAQFTSVRVVCQNTLSMAMRSGGDSIKVSHRSVFDPIAVKRELGIDQTFDAFVASVDRMAGTRIGDRAAADTIWTLFADGKDQTKAADLPKQNRDKIETVWNLYKGKAHGAELVTAKGTVWGLLNAVTEYVDHQYRARSDENRLASAWFGQGKAIKDKAFALLAA